jgi:tetratricopeptide (TPR) repeat protein
MSSSVTKSLKKSSSRGIARRSGAKSAPAKRTVPKSTRLKPATKRSPAGKARANKATKAKTTKARSKPVKVAVKKAARKAPAKLKQAKKAGRSATQSQRTTPRRKLIAARVPAIFKKPTPPPPPPQLTRDEAAALKAFEAAHKEFTRGHFAEARSMFRSLVEKYPMVSEVTARARTYLAVAEARLKSDLAMPRDADSLYDRGVIELNRGEYVAAQELFERALRREPNAAHIHYGLAATRARLGAIDTALKSLERALDLQPSLRIRAQRDQDLNPLRSDPDFDQIVFATRE